MLKFVSKKTESIESGQKRSNFWGHFYYSERQVVTNQRHQKHQVNE